LLASAWLSHCACSDWEDDMAAAPNPDDDKALSAILECLSYAERELRLLAAPMPDAADLVGQAAQVIERKLAAAPAAPVV
jgi:hypothetical protein